MKERSIKLTVIATNRHCSNDCPGISFNSEHCNWFEKPLKWDPNRMSHGRLRLSECRAAQLSAEVD